MRVAFVLALLLASCGEERSSAPKDLDRQAAPAPAPPPEGTAVPAPVAIVGEWRVAGVGDDALTQPYGISVSISESTIRAVSQCVVLEWTYHLRAGEFRAFTRPSEIPLCARTRTADERALETAMAEATEARRLDSGALLIAGPGGRITLFTQ